jgi:hypothetical protein
MSLAQQVLVTPRGWALARCDDAARRDRSLPPVTGLCRALQGVPANACRGGCSLLPFLSWLCRALHETCATWWPLLAGLCRRRVPHRLAPIAALFPARPRFAAYCLGAVSRAKNHLAQGCWRGKVLEVLNWFAGTGPLGRALATTAVRTIRADHLTQVLPQTSAAFDAALALYEARPDKGYSLPDCRSMLALRDWVSAKS